MAKDASDPHVDRIRRALESDVPKIYFNGFVNGFGTGDVTCVLERNGLPVGILNMSYTVAKTLSTSLAQLISGLESASEQTIMTTHEIEHFVTGKPLKSRVEVLEDKPAIEAPRKRRTRKTKT